MSTSPTSTSDNAHHVTSVRAYVLVFLALWFFTGLTVVAAYTNLGVFNTPVALGIAIVKALLVVLVFMHVWYSPRLTKLVAGGALLWLLILLFITLADYVSRGWLGYPGT
jgi:cytochrome c oxidase subunit 4